MKTFNFVIGFILAAAFFTGCNPNPGSKVVWRKDGTVIGSSGKQAKLELQSVYDGVTFKDVTYVIGFKIEKDGTNIPHIAQVAADLTSILYWPFEAIINDIFIYQNALHANSTNGEVYVLTESSWETADFVFPADSHVIHADSQESLVVCHSAPMSMNAKHDGGCYSVAPPWKFNFVWFTVTPKICDGALFTFEEKPEGGIFRALSLNTGEVLFFKVLRDPPGDICAVVKGGRPD